MEWLKLIKSVPRLDGWARPEEKGRSVKLSGLLSNPLSRHRFKYIFWKLGFFFTICPTKYTLLNSQENTRQNVTITTWGDQTRRSLRLSLLSDKALLPSNGGDQFLSFRSSPNQEKTRSSIFLGQDSQELSRDSKNTKEIRKSSLKPNTKIRFIIIPMRELLLWKYN